MKTIAVPLLLASSAGAQQTKKERMMQDRMFPEPILIATGAWVGADVCVDDTVTAKKGLLTTAESALKGLKDTQKTLAAAVTAAVGAKKAKVDLVVAKQVEIATLLKTDDTAQQSELTLKTAYDNATFAKGVQDAVVATALGAKGAADLALSGAKTIQGELAKNAKAAKDHYDLEKKTWDDAVKDEAAKKLDWDKYDNVLTENDAGLAATPNAYLAAAQKKETDTKKTFDADTVAKAAADAFETKVKAEQAVGAALVKAGGTDFDKVASEKTTTKSKLNVFVADDLSTYTKIATDFKTAAQQTSTALKAWKDVSESADNLTVFTDMSTVALSTAKFTCKNTQATAAMIDPNSADTAEKCAKECLKKKSWDLVNSIPKAGAGTYPNLNGTTVCYGFQFSVNGAGHSSANQKKCKLYDDGEMKTDAKVADDANVTSMACYKRNKTLKAPDVAKYLTASQESGTLWKTLNDAVKAWGAQAKIQQTSQVEVDIATAYNAKMTDPVLKDATKAVADAKAKVDVSSPAYLKEKGAAAAALIEWTKFDTLNKNAKAAWDLSQTATINAKKELDYQTGVKKIVDDDSAAQTALVGVAGVSATGLELAAATAKSTWEAEVKTAGTKGTDVTDAKKKYEDQVKVAAGSASNAKTGIEALESLRKDADAETKKLGDEIKKLTDQDGLVAADVLKVGVANVAYLAAVVSCKEGAWKTYKDNLATAETKRATDLKAIGTLIDKAIADKPKAGAAGARCEKAQSNGTARPKRDETTCAAELCCGAAKIPVGEAVMIVETCQPVATTEYSYVKPRSAMATVLPTAEKVPFTCIQGAQKLAAAASAALAAVYMLA